MSRGRKEGTKDKRRHIWTDEEKEYLKSIVNDYTGEDIAKLMSDKFNYDFDVTQIRSAIARYKLRIGIETKFQKGNIPWNKGTKGKGICKPNKGSFKKGHEAFLNSKPLYSEIVDEHGYIRVKVAERKWVLKHRLIYEQHHGKIEEGYRVMFADTDKTNFDIDNLILVNAREIFIANKNKFIKEDAELTKAGVNCAKLIAKIVELKK